MLTESQSLLSSALLTLVMLLTASGLRSRAWTLAGLKIGFGNRERLPEPTPLSGRADRAAKNMLEGLLMFMAVVTAARFAGAESHRLELGATAFFWARLAYFGVYLAGIAYLRTAIWVVSLAGIFMIGAAAL